MIFRTQMNRSEVMITMIEMDENVSFGAQLKEPTGPVVLINRFRVPAAQVDRFLEVWSRDAAFMKGQAGFISTQLHRGVGGSTTFVNTAVWESAHHLKQAVLSPEFKSHRDDYPDGVEFSPHVFARIAVSNICVA
jgi:heme-degrading monooxygenase HmoA